jgi:hypothetical protein
MAANAVDSLASVFHDSSPCLAGALLTLILQYHNSWLLTASCIKPPIASTTCLLANSLATSCLTILTAVKVILRVIVSEPVCLVVRHPFGARDQIFITIKQLQIYWCAMPYMTRGRVCTLQLLLAVILRSESLGTHEHILLSQIQNFPQPGGVQVPYWYPPGIGWPSYTLKHWLVFSSPVTTRRASTLGLQNILSDCS